MPNYPIDEQDAVACNSELHLIDVDLHTGVVKIGSKASDLQEQLGQLNSQDALTLSVMEAAKAGITSPLIKYTNIVFGDAKKGIVSNKPPKPVQPGQKRKKGEEYDPFLCVTLHSATLNDTTFQGDSL